MHQKFVDAVNQLGVDKVTDITRKRHWLGMLALDVVLNVHLPSLPTLRYPRCLGSCTD